MEKRGRHSKEFKIEAIRLLNEGNKPTSELAMELELNAHYCTDGAISSLKKVKKLFQIVRVDLFVMKKAN